MPAYVYLRGTPSLRCRAHRSGSASTSSTTWCTSWDVGRSIDVPVSFDDEGLAAVLPIAEPVPDGANRTVPGAAFKPGIEATSGTTAPGNNGTAVGAKG